MLHRPHGGGGQSQSATVQNVHGDSKSVTRLPEDILRWDVDIVETQHHRVGAAQAHLHGMGPHREAFEARLDQKGRQRIIALDLWCACKNGDHTGYIPIADPDLAAVEPPAVTVAHSGALDGLGIAASLALGQSEGSDSLAAGQLGQVPRLLFVRAIENDTLQADGQVRAEHEHQRRAHAGDALDDAAIGRRAQPKATVLLRDRDAKQAERSHAELDLVRDTLLAVDSA